MDDFDVKKARVKARCDEEERVEKPDESEDRARFAKLRRWLHGVWKAGRRLFTKTVDGWVQMRQSSEKDQVKDVRVV